MAKLKNYYDFANDDYHYFKDSIKNNMIYNNMLAEAQNSCEKFLKYIIHRYYEPTSQETENEKIDILSTHSLRKLVNFINTYIDGEIDEEKKGIICLADGYYFDARYPGDFSIEYDRIDIGKCDAALDEVKSYVKEYIINHEFIKDEFEMQYFLITSEIPEQLKEPILVRHYNDINWEKIHNDTINRIKQKFPNFYNAFISNSPSLEDYAAIGSNSTGNNSHRNHNHTNDINIHEH